MKKATVTALAILNALADMRAMGQCHNYMTLSTHGEGRPLSEGDTPCHRCNENAADGLQDDNRGSDPQPVCNLCAAPGRPLDPLA